MKRIAIFFLLFIMFGIISCHDQKTEKDVIRKEMKSSKEEIENTLSSSEIFFRSIIEELENNPQNLSDIKSRFEIGSQVFETEIKEELNKINKLGEEGKISNKDGDKMINDLRTSQALKDYKKIKYLISSLEEKK